MIERLKSVFEFWQAGRVEDVGALGLLDACTRRWQETLDAVGCPHDPQAAEAFCEARGICGDHPDTDRVWEAIGLLVLAARIRPFLVRLDGEYDSVAQAKIDQDVHAAFVLGVLAPAIEADEARRRLRQDGQRGSAESKRRRSRPLREYVDTLRKEKPRLSDAAAARLYCKAHEVGWKSWTDEEKKRKVEACRRQLSRLRSTRKRGR